jgi:hypothetical protein
MDLFFAVASKNVSSEINEGTYNSSKSVAKYAPLIRNYVESSEEESNNQKYFVQTNCETGDYDFCN